MEACNFFLFPKTHISCGRGGALRRYVLKLRQELEEFTADIFAGAAEREQIRSVLADLAKTSGDFRQLAGWALASLATALMNRLRWDSTVMSPVAWLAQVDS